MKDTEKKQPLIEPRPVSESKITSAALTLQLLNKEKEKSKETERKEYAAEAAKIRCRTCFKEIAPKRFCFGHGGGGGGGGDSAVYDEAYEGRTGSEENNSLTNTRKTVETADEMAGVFGSAGVDSEFGFDPKVIEELIAKGLLLVDNDRKSMTLTIKLLCEPNALTIEQRQELKKFMETIIKEFNTFKNEHNLSDDCMKIIRDEKGNILSLHITLPTLALYDAFIERLANNLVPIPGPQAQKTDDVTEDQNIAPNPKDKSFKNEHMPLYKDGVAKKTEEEEQTIFSPSPFNTKPW